MNQQKGTEVPPSIISPLHLHPAHPAPAGERVPVWRKAAYGSGGLTDFLFPNIINALAVPIYSIALKMDPVLAVCLMPFLLVPAKPYLTMIEWVILAFGIPCANLMFSSMMADICDEDELVHSSAPRGRLRRRWRIFRKGGSSSDIVARRHTPKDGGIRRHKRAAGTKELKVIRGMLIGI
ncbi:MAG TPA: hypothetical protein VIS99_09055 [Terrimicrobiaceae bacterium]